MGFAYICKSITVDIIIYLWYTRKAIYAEYTYFQLVKCSLLMHKKCKQKIKNETMSPFHVWYTSLYLSNKRSETKNLILRANRYIVQNKKSNKTMFLSVFTEILSILNFLQADKHFLTLRNLCHIEFLCFCRMIRNNLNQMNVSI